MLAATWLTAAPVSASGVARPPVTPIHASKIILVGDSTTAVQSGWGADFCARHVTSALTCTNLARGGRSTYSYRADGSWDLALEEMRSGRYAQVWVVVQFGHNDQPGKPERSTDLATEFPANLRRYVEDIRSAGAIPVLVTPLTRRQFDRGVLRDDLAPWAASVHQVARQLDVPLVDLHARSRAVVQGMGPVLSTQLAQRPATTAQVKAAQAGDSLEAKAPVADTTPAAAAVASAANAGTGAETMATPKLAFDYTHLGPEGAALFSAIMADELARQLPALRSLLIP
ncbi:MAG: rhamnogalacturonan acetylesterase [Pseudoxanthomonas sp.]